MYRAGLGSGLHAEGRDKHTFKNGIVVILPFDLGRRYQPQSSAYGTRKE
jgi:hypothetical protein